MKHNESYLLFNFYGTVPLENFPQTISTLFREEIGNKMKGKEGNYERMERKKKYLFFGWTALCFFCKILHKTK